MADHLSLDANNATEVHPVAWQSVTETKLANCSPFAMDRSLRKREGMYIPCTPLNNGTLVKIEIHVQ